MPADCQGQGARSAPVLRMYLALCEAESMRDLKEVRNVPGVEWSPGLG
jgi:hypothetical protein